MTMTENDRPTWGFRIRRYYHGEMYSDYITPSHMSAYRNELGENSKVTIVSFDDTDEDDADPLEYLEEFSEPRDQPRFDKGANRR